MTCNNNCNQGRTCTCGQDRWAESEWHNSIQDSAYDSQPYYRLRQHFTPRPAVPVTWWRRVVRWVVGRMT